MSLPFIGRGASRSSFFAFILGAAFLLVLLYQSQPPPSPFRAPIDDVISPDPSKLLVVATDQQRVSETRWVDELPDWPHRIYVAGDTSAEYHTTLNKGNEANHYLTYIKDNYDDLPDVVVFTHHHNEARHIDVSLKTNVNTLQRLNLTHVQAKGYQTLRCVREKHCLTKSIEWWTHTNDEFREAWAYAFPSEPCPELVVGPCCAQFAVSKQAIQRLPKNVYQRLHKWLLKTKRHDIWAGRVFEHMWHILFGKPAIYCVDQDPCYCSAFGLCQPGQNLGWTPDLENDPLFQAFNYNETINE